MSSLWDQWSGRDAKMRKEGLAVSIDWGEKANAKFLNQLAATWGRQRVHHANLCRETQRARREAFVQRRKTRLEAVKKLEETFAREKAESDASLLASRLGARRNCLLYAACSPHTLRTHPQACPPVLRPWLRRRLGLLLRRRQTVACIFPFNCNGSFCVFFW